MAVCPPLKFEFATLLSIFPFLFMFFQFDKNVLCIFMLIGCLSLYYILNVYYYVNFIRNFKSGFKLYLDMPFVLGTVLQNCKSHLKWILKKKTANVKYTLPSWSGQTIFWRLYTPFFEHLLKKKVNYIFKCFRFYFVPYLWKVPIIFLNLFFFWYLYLFYSDPKMRSCLLWNKNVFFPATHVLV